MTTETINGLLIQKPTSPAPSGERWFTWEEKQGKSGKPYIKIKNESREYGGELCRIIGAEQTDFVDSHGNVSYNVEFVPISPSRTVPTNNDDFIPMTHDAKGAALSGVDETKRHIMQAVNLYNLCVDAVDTCIKPRVQGMTAELYQAAIASLFIEASSRQSPDGVNWWSYVDKMPVTKPK